MSHITLVRHGQANTEARDEESYDKLSPLGHQQAEWLGAHFRASDTHHTRVYSGTLRRHIETATGMGHTDAERDPRLNELEYFTLAGLLEQQHGVVIPTAREEFVYHLPKVFEAWRQGIIEGPPETFQNFEARVSDAMHDIAAGQGPALVITSGGLIAMTMRRFLGLEVPALARVALAIMNTSVHRLFPIGEQLSPVLFNAVPHLEQPDQHYAQTHL